MATIRVHVPGILRELYDAAESESVDASSPRLAIERLNERFPGLRERVCEPDGTARKHINMFVNHQHIHALDGMDTHLADGDELWIIPAVSGG
jgi:molybdopterin converting factor small subunit